jgi:hypothetical protein
MFRLWQLKRRVRIAERRYARAYSDCRKNNVAPEQSIAVERTNSQLRDAEAAVEAYVGFLLLSEAQALDVEIPLLNDREMWTSDEQKSTTWFSPKGRTHVRKLIDAEKARRFEVKTLWVTKFWLPLLAALVGIIGALTGLFAVLQHKK